jgi:hypothetical protein
MGRFGLVTRVGLWLSVTAVTASVTCGMARADTRTRSAWCEANQLTLSSAKGPHAIFGQAESTIWFLQMRNRSRSTCQTGAWLTVTGAQATNGEPIGVRDVADPGGLGGNARAFALPPRARAFVELELAFPTAASRGCKLDALLSFSLPDRGGALAVRVPREVGALCQGMALDISPTCDTTAFFHFMQELDTTPSQLPYARRAAFDFG